MTNKIIETARLAGFFIDEDSRKYQPRCIFHTRYLIDDELARFYAIVRNQALEDAARECEKMIVGINEERDWARGDCAHDIRALKETQPPQGGADK